MNLLELFTDHTLRTVAMGASLIGISAGALGTFAVLRRQSLVGDAISHAALPGVAIAFLVGSSIDGSLAKHPLVLLIGAAVAGWLGTLCVMLITRNSKIKSDTALGIILSVFFGFGLVLRNVIQNLPTASKAGLDKYLFGNAATMLESDVVTIGVLGLIVLILMILGWKEFKLLSFDPEFMAVQGFSTRFFDISLTTLIVIAIVIGLQTVGVILMSALLVAPAVAARQYSNKLSVVVLLSAVFGGLSGVIGAVLSSTVPGLSTGPTIVLVVSAIVFLSLFFAPARGLFWDHLRHMRQHREVEATSVLIGLKRLADQHENPFHSHSIEALDAVGIHVSTSSMSHLQKKGLVANDGEQWHLTRSGLEMISASKLEEDSNA